MSKAAEDKRVMLRRHSIVDPNTGCWIWVGRRNTQGYGSITVVFEDQSGQRRRRSTGAHRYSYEVHSGKPIPKGLLCCHTCDNPPCINPEHLFLGTPKENTHDCVSKDRHVRGERHGQSKLTQKIVDEARALAMNGVSNHDLARMFGVHHTTIGDAVSGRSWFYGAVQEKV